MNDEIILYLLSGIGLILAIFSNIYAKRHNIPWEDIQKAETLIKKKVHPLFKVIMAIAVILDFFVGALIFLIGVESSNSIVLFFILIWIKVPLSYFIIIIKKETHNQGWIWVGIIAFLETALAAWLFYYWSINHVTMW